jgi:hypothetical protein
MQARNQIMTVPALTALLVTVLALGSAAQAAKPLKVYILAGQSNMEGTAHVKTFDHVGMDPKTASLHKEMIGPDGEPRVCDDVYIYLGTKDAKKGKLTAGYGSQKKNGPCIGPEFTFGIYMHKRLKEPILLIKTAWGGKSLYHDFRPPSAGEWKPSKGHPDLTVKPLPIPEKLDLPVGFVPGKKYYNKYANYKGFFLGITRLRGCSFGQHGGVYPLYVTQSPKQKFTGDPLLAGDVIVGINGEGMRENPVSHFRQAIEKAKSTTWTLDVVRWRNGKISKVVVDLSEQLPNGRADVESVKRERAAALKESAKLRGHYYREMVKHVNDALSDIKSIYPDYDSKQGYSIEGFVWFQGWNDRCARDIYPNGHLPRGYERYSWLLSHFIRDVRKDLKAPDMKFVIGVLGVGVPEKPDYFRHAMEAPAKDPEFKGTVKAVWTEKYWDRELDELSARWKTIGDKGRELQQTKGLQKEELKKALEEYTQEILTPKELEILRAGRSNPRFHYLGSAKIFGQIGQAFAEAMLKMERSQ